MKDALIAGLVLLGFAGSAGAEPPRPPDDGKGGEQSAPRDHVRPAPRGEGGPGRRGKHPGASGGREMAARMMQTLDTNRDGKISFAEFQGAKTVAEVPEKMQRALFHRFDKNKDGVIKPGELPAGAGPSWQQRPGDGIGHLDANRDGRVSKMEFFKSPRIRNIPVEKQKEIFNRIDRNHDGFIDGRDRHRGPHHDGGPGRGRGPMDPAQLRAELDRDKDGAVSFDEFSAHPRFGALDEDQREDLFESMDTNGDHKLDGADKPGAPTRERMRPAPNGPGGEKGPDRRGPPKPPKASRSPST